STVTRRGAIEAASTRPRLRTPSSIAQQELAHRGRDLRGTLRVQAVRRAGDLDAATKAQTPQQLLLIVAGEDGRLAAADAQHRDVERAQPRAVLGERVALARAVALVRLPVEL